MGVSRDECCDYGIEKCLLEFGFWRCGLSLTFNPEDGHQTYTPANLGTHVEFFADCQAESKSSVVTLPGTDRMAGSSAMIGTINVYLGALSSTSQSRLGRVQRRSRR